MPGSPFDARSAGCNQLIRDGAALVRQADDVIEALQPIHGAPELPLIETLKPGPKAEDKPHHNLRKVAALHNMILARLSPAPIPEDQLIRDLAVSASEAAPALLDLELDGQITRQSGGLLSKA